MSKTARQADISFDPEDPRCNDGGPACEGCLMVGWCIGDYPPAVATGGGHERSCCGALASGPHKMGCDYKMHKVPTLDEVRATLGPWGAAEAVGKVLPTTTVKPNEINGLRAETACFGSSAHHGRSCRCGPDGCADSGCPGHNRNDG